MAQKVAGSLRKCPATCVLRRCKRQAIPERRATEDNPPAEWIEPVASTVGAEDTFADVPAEARALIRQSAITAAAAKDSRVKKRTLTNLHNERPQWLKLAHEELDRAVLAAYAATDPEGGWSEDRAAGWTGAGQPLPGDHPLFAERQKVDQNVLANLLRLNQKRGKEGTTPAKIQDVPAANAEPKQQPNAKA